MSRPSRYEWVILRPEIEALYKHSTTEEIALVLRERGYDVNARIIKQRLSRWNIYKTCREREMITALCLLSGQERSPSFLVSGRPVRLQQVVSYFRKKGISDPLVWVRQNVGADYELAHNVELMASPSAEPPPSIHMPLSALASTTQEYCLRYLASARQRDHLEPQVHRDTIHGRFGDLMQQGAYNLRRGGIQEAFVSIRAAFLIVPQLMQDHHPMALCQYMAIACELIACEKATASGHFAPLVDHMLRFAREVSTGELQEIMQAMIGSQDHLQAALLFSRCATDLVTSHAPHTWKSLYLQERLADSLYHAGEDSSTLRRALLIAQETHYQPTARNVLWTMTNVADDFLTIGDYEAATHYFNTALQRADSLQGFYRAKIRFAALEGLARTKLKAQPGCELHARRLLVAAHFEAVTWFEPTSRRIKRVEHQIASLPSQPDADQARG